MAGIHVYFTPPAYTGSQRFDKAPRAPLCTQSVWKYIYRHMVLSHRIKGEILNGIVVACSRQWWWGPVADGGGGGL